VAKATRVDGVHGEGVADRRVGGLTQLRLLGTELAMMLDRDLFDYLEHTNVAAFVVTDGGEICSWNAGAEALFGFGFDEVLGRT
jgi:PAS domain-containing protein